MAGPAKKSSARIPAQPEAAPVVKTTATAPATPAPAAPAAKTAAPAATPTAKIDAKERYQLVAREAYFLAEKRGFAAGKEMEDWIAAEKTVAARLAAAR